SRSQQKLAQLLTVVRISKRSEQRFFGNERPSRKCCAPSPVRRTSSSPYCKLSSTAQYICAQQSRAASVLSRKRAFVSLHINWTPQCQSGCRQSFWNTAALWVASTEASRRSTPPT